MSILSVDNISPIGSGTSVTINNAATLVLNNVSVAGVSTITGVCYPQNGIRVPDDIYSYFGTGNDLSIRHDATGGNHSYIFHHGTGAFKLASDTQMILGETGPRNYIQMNPNSDVKLYFNNNEKFATSNTGATLTGNLAVSAGNGIDFSAQTAGGGSVVSEVMNHFSTGTIGLTLKAGSNTVPLYNNTARYTRIGNICFISAWIRVNGSTVGSSYSSSDTLKITGFPFAPAGNNDGRTRMRFNGYAFASVTDKTWGWLVISDGATTTEFELHWGVPQFSTIVAPNGTNIHNSSSEIYINGHYFV